MSGAGASPVLPPHAASVAIASAPTAALVAVAERRYLRFRMRLVIVTSVAFVVLTSMSERQHHVQMRNKLQPSRCGSLPPARRSWATRAHAQSGARTGDASDG